MNELNIAGRLIGENHEPVVIAEIGINHGGNLDLAIEIADSAIDQGCEIIKHQTHVIEDEMSNEAKKIIPGNANESIYEIMQKCALSEKDEKVLMNHIVGKGSIYISTPFSRLAVERLKKFNVPAIKIGSGECNNYPLIKEIVKLRKPVIVSTGMNSIKTIKPAVDILKSAKIPYALLHCTNIYPTPPHLVRLGAIETLRNNFPDAVIGLSDHTTSNHTCLAAVGLGASILERHFTDNMDREGPDIACSMDPSALRDLITGSKIIYSARGNAKEPVIEEQPTIAFAFASVVATKDIKAGSELNKSNIWVMRPGGGDFDIKDFDKLHGKIAAENIKKGYQIKKKQIVGT